MSVEAAAALSLGGVIVIIVTWVSLYNAGFSYGYMSGYEQGYQIGRASMVTEAK